MRVIDAAEANERILFDVAADCAEDPRVTTLCATDVRELLLLDDEETSTIIDVLLLDDDRDEVTLDDDGDEEERRVVGTLLDLEVDELDRMKEGDVLLLCEDIGTEEDREVEDDATEEGEALDAALVPKADTMGLDALETDDAIDWAILEPGLPADDDVTDDFGELEDVDGTDMREALDEDADMREDPGP